MHDVLTGKSATGAYEAYTAEQQYEIQKVAETYLTGQLDDIETINSVRHANELLNQMRNLFRKAKQEGDNLLAQGNHKIAEKGG